MEAETAYRDICGLEVPRVPMGQAETDLSNSPPSRVVFETLCN